MKNNSQFNSHYSRRKHAAFTLAEVLITLAIIGVVAALTIPTLISNYKDKELETSYIKSKATLANGFKLMLANNDVYNVSQLPLFKCTDNTCRSAEFSKVFKIAVDDISNMSLPDEYTRNTQLPSYITLIPPAFAEDKSSFSWSDTDYIFQLQDGAIYGINTDDNVINIVADLNGAATPNTVAKDLYKFQVSGNATITDATGDLNAQTEQVPCSLLTPEGCTTEEQCSRAFLCSEGVVDDSGNCVGCEMSPKFENGKCTVYLGPGACN